VEKILRQIRAKEEQMQHLHRDASEGDLKQTLEELNTQGLFSSKKTVYLEGVDKLKKGELSSLCAYVEKPSPMAYLILGASSGKGLSELYVKGKKELIGCDLSEEKPWELKGRLKAMLIDHAAQSGKRFHPEALDYLLDHVGLHLPSLEKEVDKLMTYGMERGEISLSDVKLLCFTEKSLTLWQLIDAVVEGTSFPKIEENVDLGVLLPLFSQLRSQLEQGLAVAVLLRRGVPPHEMAAHIPSLKPASLNKTLSLAHMRPPLFFKKALDLCFEAELMAKNSSLEPVCILEMLISKLILLKNTHALSPT
jgi:DNA polymerase-3 subunit delta